LQFFQAVDHPYLVSYSSPSGANANLLDANKNEKECGFGHDPSKDYFVSVPVDILLLFHTISTLVSQ